MPEPGVLCEGNFIDNNQELYALMVAEVNWDESMRARKTASFGVAYNYSGMTYNATPMHAALVPIIDRLEQKLGFRPNNCLLNYYEDGNSTMGFHSDSEADITPDTGVAIISLGSERNITFRSKQNKQEEYHYPLKSGSLLYMPPEIQDHWKHAILKQEGIGGRISLTFRCIVAG